MSKTDEQYMARAMQLARNAADAGEVPVGAVICNPRTGDIVGEGRNGPIQSHDPTAHAEIAAIRAAARTIGNYRLTGLSMFVTLEPCAMCAGAISFARLGRLVFAASDPKGGAVINGPQFFQQPTCHWRPEIHEHREAADDASHMLQEFFAIKRK